MFLQNQASKMSAPFVRKIKPANQKKVKEIRLSAVSCPHIIIRIKYSNYLKSVNVHIFLLFYFFLLVLSFFVYPENNSEKVFRTFMIASVGKMSKME